MDRRVRVLYLLQMEERFDLWKILVWDPQAETRGRPDGAERQYFRVHMWDVYLWVPESLPLDPDPSYSHDSRRIEKMWGVDAHERHPEDPTPRAWPGGDLAVYPVNEALNDHELHDRFLQLVENAESAIIASH